MQTGLLVVALVAGLGCGRLEFGEIELRFEAKLVTGVYTADAKLCLSRPAMIKYAITTTPFRSDWTLEDLERADGAAGLISADLKNGKLGCTVVTVKAPIESPVYLYAMAGDSHEELGLANAVEEKMNPVFELKTFPVALPSPHTVRYWVHFPEAYYRDKSAPQPTLLYLHGSGKDGMDNGANIGDVLNESPLPFFRQSKEAVTELPFLLYAPQCNGNQGNCFGWGGSSKMPILDQVLEHLRTVATVDDARFYTTGISTGGEGAWRYAIHRPELVSAVVPIGLTYSVVLPRPDFYDDEMCKMVGIPVWAFHNSTDATQPPRNSQEMKARLDRCGASTVQLDLGNWGAPGAHSGWEEAYGNTHGFTNGGESSIYNWMLSHTKR